MNSIPMKETLSTRLCQSLSSCPTLHAQMVFFPLWKPTISWRGICFSKRRCHGLVVVQVHLVHSKAYSASSLSSPECCILVLLPQKVCRRALGSMAWVLVVPRRFPWAHRTITVLRGRTVSSHCPPLTTGCTLSLPPGPSLVTELQCFTGV